MPHEQDDPDFRGLDQLIRIFGENAVLDCGDNYVICFPRKEAWQGGSSNLHKKALRTLAKLGAPEDELMAFRAANDDRVQIRRYTAERPVFIEKLKAVPDGKYARHTRGHEPLGTDKRDDGFESPEDESWRQSLADDDGWKENPNSGGWVSGKEYNGSGERWKKHKQATLSGGDIKDAVLQELNGWHDKTRWRVADMGGQEVFTTLLPIEQPGKVMYALAEKLNIPSDSLTFPPKGRGRPVIPCHAVTEDNVARLKHINPRELKDALEGGEQEIRK